jgi:hypothetical protein
VILYPDAPVTMGEYEMMKQDALSYMTLPDRNRVTKLQREDRAFLLYEVNKYEQKHGLKATFDSVFVDAEYTWWRTCV